MSVAAAFYTVAIMLFCAVPGYLMIKTGLVGGESISAFAKLLLFVCQPALVISTVTGVDCTKETVIDLLMVFAISLASELIMIGVMLLILKKKINEVKYRIYSIATCMGNVSFMGVPVIKSLLPGNAEAVAFTAMASLALNVFGWTVASAVITKDRKYISAKKIIFNPAILAMLFSIPLFLTNTDVPGKLGDMVSLIGSMSTPLCMLIMGMRLATSNLKTVFCRVGNYVTVIIKQMIYPLTVLGIISLFPFPYEMKAAIYIISCCPIASMVLNFSELLGEGQKEAAGVLLLGTALSCLTLPLMMLLI